MQKWEILINNKSKENMVAFHHASAAKSPVQITCGIYRRIALGQMLSTDAFRSDHWKRLANTDVDCDNSVQC